jgi:signal transduction histidine kinase
MARGDLETPVPEVGRDEIGQLADALEHFRQQALEVQRLNLVEQLYGELQEANAELQRMQARLVAQEKLAALGELVSGVAHEISNPLNFVKNFSEGSIDLYSELSEMLQNYRDRMSDADASLLDELSEEITESLSRVSHNGGRALAIVERMRSLSVEGGTPVMADLNAVLHQAVQQGCNTFESEWDDFHVEVAFDLDDTVEEQMLAERDFGEAVVNLVSNACFAMQQKRKETGNEYQPRLIVSSHLSDGTVEVRVRDNGPGIPDENVGRIFNPFFSTRDGAQGAGLGLPIAADVARRMGGDLVVDTILGEYAEFTMHIPVVVEEEPQDTEDMVEGMAGIVERMSSQS